MGPSKTDLMYALRTQIKDCFGRSRRMRIEDAKNHEESATARSVQELRAGCRCRGDVDVHCEDMI